MGQDNFISVTGNLTRDPELRTVNSGANVVNFTVAVNRRWKNASTNEWDEQVSFIDVSCWDDMATNIASSLSQGSRVVVSGRIEQRNWETENGDKRSKLEIRADEVSASLRWATVDIHRNERTGGSNNQGGAANSGNPTPAMAGAATGDSGYDEEPF